MKEFIAVLLVWILACVLVDAGRSFANSVAKSEVENRNRTFEQIEQEWKRENL